MSQSTGSPGLVFTDDFLDAKRLIADPVADQLVADLVEKEGRESAKRLFDTLITHIEFPVEQLPVLVQEFFESNQKLPEWADPVQISKAQDLFIDHGPKFLIFLYYKSLPILYSCANGAEVLVRTGRLAHREKGFEQFSRRIAETGQFLVEVMAPGSFTGKLTAIKAALKVRLIHASIRQFIPKESWDTKQMGEPINQEDLAITLMTFSIAILDALEQSGIDESEDKKEAYLHTWKVLGHFLGINHDLFPQSMDDAKLLLNKIIERQSRKSEAGILLTSALLDFSAKNLPTEILKDAPKVLLRFFSGNQIADALEVYPPYGCLLSWMPEFLKSMFVKGEKLEERSPAIRLVVDKLSQQTTLRMINYFNTSKNANFRIPETLKSHWFIKK